MYTKGNGSIYQVDRTKTKYSCRRWRLHVSCGKDYKTGRYIQKTRRFTGTYSEAKTALRDFIAELQEQDYTSSGKRSYTLQAYSDYFLDLRKAQGDVSQSTLDKNRYHYTKLNELIGKAKLDELTPSLMEDAFRKLHTTCSGTYLKGIYNSCNLMFNHAVKTGVLGKNPLESITAPKEDTKEKEVIPNKLLTNFIDALDTTDRIEIALYLIAVYGLRRSEPTYIRWQDVNFQEGIIKIPKSKTKKGIRLLPITTKAATALESRKATVLSQRRSLGLQWCEDAPICADADGCGITPRMITAWWEKHAREYGMQDYTPHSFRHTFTTNLAKTRTHPSVMANILGHSSSRVTMDIYTHINTQEKAKALNELDQFYERFDGKNAGKNF